MDSTETYRCSVSTRWERNLDKIALPPEAQEKRRRSRPSVAKLTVWPRRQRLSMTITYRGGSEAWYEIKTRGRTWRVPGHVAIEDVMAWIYAEY